MNTLWLIPAGLLFWGAYDVDANGLHWPNVVVFLMSASALAFVARFFDTWTDKDGEDD